MEIKVTIKYRCYQTPDCAVVKGIPLHIEGGKENNLKLLRKYQSTYILASNNLIFWNLSIETKANLKTIRTIVLITALLAVSNTCTVNVKIEG